MKDRSVLDGLGFAIVRNNRGNLSSRKQQNKFLFYINHYLFLLVLDLHCYAQASSICNKPGLLFIAACGLLIAAASLVAKHRL